MYSLWQLSFLVLLLDSAVNHVAAKQCRNAPISRIQTPSLAQGYDIQLVASGLNRPRGLKFDKRGNLLVVEQYTGISALTLKNTPDGCVTVLAKKPVIRNTGLNHGIELSPDGKTLYASSQEAVFSWPYNALTTSPTGKARPLIRGMSNDDHSTRTLLLSKSAPGQLIVSRGSAGNLDAATMNVSSGRSQLKSFDLASITTPVDFTTSGTLLAWGLRNSVGVTEEPTTGNLYTVENSVDSLLRAGKDIHENNPGEEMNFHGKLSDPNAPERGRNYGYPSCVAAWAVNAIPKHKNLEVGTQFAIQDANKQSNDTSCANDYQAPRLTFQAHMAPLDIKFNAEGTAAWVAFHGSWDRTDPIGYKVAVIEFANGEPKMPSDSATAATDVVYNADLSRCPGRCFRPASLAWDAKGRLFMSSDATGEIYAIDVPKTVSTSKTDDDGAAAPHRHRRRHGMAAAFAAGAAIVA